MPRFQRGRPGGPPGGLDTGGLGGLCGGLDTGGLGGTNPIGGTACTGGRQVGQVLPQPGSHGLLQSQNRYTSGNSGAQHGQAGLCTCGKRIGMIGMVINPLLLG
jgi:hypothetical protein